MSNFVFVPGAWHGAWCWERVIPLLTAAGHSAVAPELIGMGADQARAAQGSLAGWVDQIATVVSAAAEPVVLVGHSRGGAIISQVAERVPDRIATLVYVAALLLPDGRSIREQMGAPETLGEAASTEILKRDDGTCTVHPDHVPAAFYNTTAPEWVARAIARLGPEPMASLHTPVRVTPARFGRVRRAYVECLQDRAVPLAAQRAMQENWRCDPVITLDCDHSPFYALPEQLAAALQTIVASTGPST